MFSSWFGGSGRGGSPAVSPASPSAGDNDDRSDSPVLVDRDNNNNNSNDDDGGGNSAGVTTATTSPSPPLGPGFRTVAPPSSNHPKSCCVLVTGSSGLCGARLVEMLLERGAGTVVALDRAVPDAILQARFAAVQQRTGGTIVMCTGPDEGDITQPAQVARAFDGSVAPPIHVVFHIAALVGPFYDAHQYRAVNFEATNTIIRLCQQYNVSKLVYSSSPSTRFTGADVTGQTEDELPMPTQWLARYAETKAYGEMAVTAACGSTCADGTTTLLTISVAPHQIYGPHDHLFLTKILETAGNGRLRIFGKGVNRISVCYVDNYCHGLLCGADALQPQHVALAKFYIITDGEPQYFWHMINDASMAMGFADLRTKWHLPVWLLYGIAHVCDWLTSVTGRKFKLTVFNVKMMTIHRYFSLAHARRDLQYEPVVPFATAWPLTLEWFRTHWLPQFQANQGKAASLATKTTVAVSSKMD